LDKIIEITNLSKRFKDVKAVNDLSLTVYKGDVFGFLGPNGAGKSTTIRMLLSLINPDQGDIKIFGKSLKENRKDILTRTGAIVEKPDFYGYLSAYKNLEILGRISGRNVDKKRIQEILEIVGLDKRYKSKVKTFSHGMKQRLGLAQALLHDPELIILDEPTTGLDPQGMKEIRDLIIYLSKEKNKTIFLSSHILYEVELVAKRMIIINKGAKQVEGYVNELLDANKLRVTLEVNDMVKTKNLLDGSSWGAKVDTYIDSKVILNLQPGEPGILNRYLIENGVEVNALIPTRSLEEYFLNIMEKDK
jgi:ABC-type multidrug transport system ATPase subunit